MSDEHNKSNAPSESLTKKAVQGTSWSLGGKVTVSAVSFLGTVILARILEPADFGLLGLATIVTGFISLVGTFGFGSALIQRKNIDDEYISSAFCANIVIAVTLIGLTVLFSPLAATFFDEPVVKYLVIALSIQFFLASLCSPNVTLLYKELKFKNIAITEVCTRFLRVVVAVFFAVLGHGVWSIVYGILAERLAKTIALMVIHPWRMQFVFVKSKFMDLFHFSKNIYGYNFVRYCSQNTDFFVTGRVLGTKSLGYYQFSYNLPHLLLDFVKDGVAPAVYPVFCRVQDDLNAMRAGLFKTVKFISVLSFPVMFGLFFVSYDFIVFVYSEKWVAASDPMKVLCFAAALASVNTINQQVFASQGRPDLGFKWGLVKLPITIASVIYLSKFGILGVAAAMLAVELLSIISTLMALHLLQAKFTDYAKALMPAFIAASLMLAGLFALQELGLFDQLGSASRFISNTLIGMMLYVAFMFTIFRKDFDEILSVVKIVLRRGNS